MVGERKSHRKEGLRTCATPGSRSGYPANKEIAGKIEQPFDLWELERYLTQRRQEIDRQYDYRYSVLLFVFAGLIQRGRLREQDLHGLSEEKLEDIRRMVQALK